MDAVEFMKFAESDPSISAFLQETSDEIEGNGIAPPETKQFAGVLGWVPILTMLLWLAKPWIKLGLQRMELRRLEMEKDLKDRAEEQGIDPKLLDKVLPPFIEKMLRGLASGIMNSLNRE